jgi:molecular chaperone DnaK
MARHLGIDFGTSNTVVAAWDETLRIGVPIHVPDFGRLMNYQRSNSESEQISVIPSLIHYSNDGQRWVGQQVRAKNLTASNQTFWWMKRRITNRNLMKQKIAGQEISSFDAGRDFLSAVLQFVAADLQLRDDEIAFTVPVEVFEHYEDWLVEVAESAGLHRVRLIDEPSAAALGYAAHIQPGQIYLVFDFGGGTLDVVVVLIEESDSAALGRRCRVLGKAGTDIGGMNIDQYLFQELLRRNNRKDTDDDVRRGNRQLLLDCEHAKERLSSHSSADMSWTNPDTGAVIGMEVTRDEFEELLDRHEVLARIDRTLRNALNATRERGYTEDHVNRVLMVGGSSLIPCVRKLVQRVFGKERVLLDRPLDAIARGAAAFVAGVDFYDHIQHSYSIRFTDLKKGDYAYRELVARGTGYPTAEAVARMTIKATHDRQTHLGIAIFEMGEARQVGGSRPIELVFDPSGHARVTQVSPDEQQKRSHFWINEGNPTFLEADPPAKQGEARFEIEFGIDSNKHLLITARDLLADKLVMQDYPVIKLS